MKTKISIMVLMLLAFSAASFSQKNDVEEAKNTIKEFKEKDPGMDKFFSSAVADTKMSQVTIGFQAGGQKYAEIIFFETAEDYDDFLSGNYEFAAQVSAVALASGASADAAYKNGILVFTMSIGGLMYEASLGGQKFKITPF
jgi:lipid-binding SYLF domain-containing protein